MLQTIEAVIDTNGRVHLLEAVKIAKKRRVLVTILPEDISFEKTSIVGSIELLDEDLEGASATISEMLNRSLQISAIEVSK